MTWKTGESGNPKGKPRNPEAEILRQALKAAKKRKGRHLIEHAVDMAYVDVEMCKAILKKILPDKMDADILAGHRVILIRADEHKDKKLST